MIPRPYQSECVQETWNYWKENPKGNGIIVVPTGGGKSYIIALLIESILKLRPNFTFLIISHVKEIVEQNCRELYRILPTQNIGVYSAGLGSKRVRRITFASIQSIYKKPELFLDVGMVIIDECHMLSRDSNSMYQKLINKIPNPRLKIVGLSATPMRMDQGSLISENSIFTDIAFDISIRRLIEEGYLSPLISREKESVDLTSVRMSGHDYNSLAMELAFAKEDLMQAHVADIIKQGELRKSWLIFCSGIDHAKRVSEIFQEKGISAGVVTGEMIGMERDKVISDFKAGKLRALCNVNVLTTGFNHPGVDLVGLLRGTKSTSLYIQMVGRGSRIAEGKKNCLVLDYGGNIERHGPIDLIEIKKGRNKKAEINRIPGRKCPSCGAVQAIRLKKCADCDYEFPESASSPLEEKATAIPVLSQVEFHEVRGSKILLHTKEGKPQMLKIQYFTHAGMFQDFLCFNHGGYTQRMAQRKWIEKGGASPAPLCTEEAYERQDEIKPCEKVGVIKKGKYYEVLKVFFMENKEVSNIVDGNLLRYNI